MLSLYYDKLIRNTEEHKGKKNLIDLMDYMLDEVLGKIKEIIGTLSTNIFKISIITKTDERWWKVTKC